MPSNIQTIENPVVDAYLKYLKDETVDYSVVFKREFRKSRERLRVAAKLRAKEKLGRRFN
jgi:hypothetical protein